MSRVITVELDPIAEAALDVLIAQGHSLDEAVRDALMATAKSVAGTPALSDTSDVSSDETMGLA